MAFFEALKRKAACVLTNGEGSLVIEEWAGINATIQALKEMMVGIPLKGNIELEITQDSTKTEADETTGILTQFTVKGGAEVWFNEHYGIDGEEVVVMVFREEG